MKLFSRVFPLVLFFSFFVFFSCGEKPIARGQLDKAAQAHQPSLLDAGGLDKNASYCISFSGGQTYPLQLGDEFHLFFPFEDFGVGASWEIYPCDDDNAHTSSQVDGLLTISSGDDPILSFATEIRLPHDTTPAYYARAGFIHPFYSPNGVELTEAYPRGHTHQHGIFHAWTRSTIKGQMVDFWNQQAQLGNIKLTRMGAVEHGSVISSFEADLEYLAYIDGDTISAARENWYVTVYPRSRKVNMIEIKIRHIPVVDPLILNEYHYGGFGVRATDAWNMEGTNLSPYDSLAYIKTSLGDTHANSNHTRPTWISLWGEIGGQTAGLAVFPHPNNFRYPQPVRVHPSMPYFTFAPMVLGEFELTPQKPYIASYLLISFDGEPDEGLIERVRESYK